jgi:hypothetical protein
MFKSPVYLEPGGFAAKTVQKTCPQKFDEADKKFPKKGIDFVKKIVQNVVHKVFRLFLSNYKKAGSSGARDHGGRIKFICFICQPSICTRVQINMSKSCI